MMNIRCKIVESEVELKQAFALRIEVFVEEQKVPPDLELDELDRSAIHMVSFHDGKIVGCGRIVMTSEHAHIGRVAVKKTYRNQGVGKQLMLVMMKVAAEKGASEIILHAQVQVIPFYESLGFSGHGDIFLDAGIEHIEMNLKV
jgi:predicted GNAT family N-acyltransferase